MRRSIGRGVTAAVAASALAVVLAACGTASGDSTSGPVTLPAGATPSASATTTSATGTPSATPMKPSATSATKPSATRSPAQTKKSTPKSAPTQVKPKPTPARAKPGEAQPKPEPAPSATPKPEPSTSTPTKPKRSDIRVGDHGPRVLTLQQRLSELGYWLGEPDGDFGHLTQQAVWAFQKSAGLSRDGVVGPRTERALDQGIRPQTRLSGNGIDINLSRQILMIVRDGRVKYILNTSTGGGYEYKQKDGDTATARTPKGTFKVYYTVDGKDEGFLGDMWRPRYFHGGYAVHGSPSIPAFPASHGCARVSNSAMNMIWARDYMPKGSTVIVR